MCTWNPISAESYESRRTRGQRKHHYTWDLDDGRPGFVRHTKKDRLKIYVDSDGDGLFTAKDELVGRARIKKPYRSLGRGEILEGDSFGSITAFNALDPTSAGPHAELSSDAGLTFGHPDGGVAAVFKRIFLPDDYL